MPFDAQSEPSETELKFTLGPNALDALADHPVRASPSHRTCLRSIYYDTPEHDLRDRGLSLRVRECDGRFVQTLKMRNSSIIARGEWECEVAGCAPEPTALGESPFGAEVRGLEDRLAPVFATVFDRAVSFWSDGDTEIEISLDTGEITAHDGAYPICELELELRRGDAGTLFRVARELSGKAHLIPCFESKAERGYRLAGHEGGAALRAEAAGIGRKTTTDDAVRQITRTCVRQISGNAELFRSSKGPRALHQVRIGIRRLRATLRVFRPAVDPVRAGAITSECGWLARELELARDIDVFADRYLAAADAAMREPALAALHARLLEAQGLASERAAQALRSKRFARLLLDLAAWAELPGVAAPDQAPCAARPVALVGRERLVKLARGVRKACLRFDDLDAAARHRLRIRVKTLRYAAEALAGAFKTPPSHVARYLAVLERLQDRLGRLNDMECAQRTAIKIVGSRASELAFTAGTLVAGRPDVRSKLIRQADKAVRQYLHAKAFWRAHPASN